MKTYDELKALIEQRGVHPEFGDAGEGWGIEQNPHELATFLCRMQELGVASVLEIGTGYRGGLSRFLAHDLGWDVTTVDVKNYGHAFEGVHYVVGHVNGQLAWMPSPDLVFIDGAHDFDSVSYDYAYYGKSFARKVIAFHDVAGFRNCEGVKELWLTLAGRLAEANPGHYEVYDIERKAGIGWIEL